jgi:hypothetical protein
MTECTKLGFTLSVKIDPTAVSHDLFAGFTSARCEVRR